MFIIYKHDPYSNKSSRREICTKREYREFINYIIIESISGCKNGSSYGKMRRVMTKYLQKKEVPQDNIIHYVRYLEELDILRNIKLECKDNMFTNISLNEQYKKRKTQKSS